MRYTDSACVRHSTEVHADSLYEAVALATRAFREHKCVPSPASRLEVEVRGPSVVHTVTLAKVQEWLEGACKSPSEKVVKERLKGLLVPARWNRISAPRAERCKIIA